MNLSPTAAAPGAAVAVSGTAKPSTDTRLLLDSSVIAPVFKTTATGAYSQSFVVPQGSPRIAKVSIRQVRGGKWRQVDSANLTILAAQPPPEPEPAPEPTPAFAIISGPSTSDRTETTIRVTWGANDYCTGVVEYSRDGQSWLRTPEETSFDYSGHIQTIRGLTPGTSYVFRVRSKNRSGAEVVSGQFAFTTLGSSPQPEPTPAPEPTPQPSGKLPPITTLGPTPANSQGKPAYLASIIDIAFGGRITCVSDMDGLRNSYPTMQPWNADGSLAFLAYPSSGKEIIDGRTYVGIRAGPDGFGYGWWDPTDPTLMYGNSLSEIKTWRPASNTYAVIGQVLGMAMLDRGKGEGGYSIGKRRQAYIFRTTAGQNGVLVWDFDLGREISRIGVAMEPNNCTISRLGNFVVIVHHRDSGKGTWLYRATDMAPLYQLVPGTPHRDVALDAEGNEILVYVNNQGTGAESIRLLDQTTRPTPIFVIGGVAGSGHISGTCHLLPGWVGISCNQRYPGAPGDDQLFLAATDGSKRVRVFNIAHTAQPQSSYNYDLSTHAAWSPDGSKVMYGGRWNGAGGNVSYAVEMP